MGTGVYIYSLLRTSFFGLYQQGKTKISITEYNVLKNLVYLAFTVILNS